MGILAIIVGGSGVGKSSIEKILCDNHDFYKIVSITTREKREREKNGIDYFFTDKEKFVEKVEKKELVENIIYDGEFYGIEKDVLNKIKQKSKKNGVVVVGIEGMKQLKSYCLSNNIKTKTFFMKSENEEKKISHLKERKMAREEISRRIKIDEEKYQEFSENLFDFILIVREGGLYNIAKFIKYCVEKN